MPRREGHARVLPFPFLLICPGRSGGSQVIDPQTLDCPCSAESTQDFAILQSSESFAEIYNVPPVRLALTFDGK